MSVLIDNILNSSPPIHYDARFQLFLERQLHVFLYRVYLARAVDAFTGHPGNFFPLYDFRTDRRVFDLDPNTTEELCGAFDRQEASFLNPYVPFRLAFSTGAAFRPEMSSGLVVDEDGCFDRRLLSPETVHAYPRDLSEKDDWWTHLKPHRH